MSQHQDPRIDAYIADAAPFAQPILTHLRKLVHQGCPAATETIKWGSPFFEQGGRILCFMAAFKAHCAFGFWHRGMKKVVAAHKATSDTAMGSLGRITSRDDLPADKAMIALVRAAAKLNESGTPSPRSATGATKEPPVPRALAGALKSNRPAARTFAALRPSHRKEYIEWIAGAKRDETRQKRLATTLRWLSEGKPLHWKYDN